MTIKTLLPQNSSDLEYDLEQVMSIATALPTELIPQLWQPENCPVEMLPWLAWAFSVDEWSSEWDEKTQRQVIKDSLYIHKHKGTLASVERALKLAGVEAGASITEWFEPKGSGIPKTFWITLPEVHASILNRKGQETLFKLVDSAKPVSVQRKIVVQASEHILEPDKGRIIAPATFSTDFRKDKYSLKEQIFFELERALGILSQTKATEQNLFEFKGFSSPGHFDFLTRNHWPVFQEYLNHLHFFDFKDEKLNLIKELFSLGLATGFNINAFSDDTLVAPSQLFSLPEKIKIVPVLLPFTQQPQKEEKWLKVINNQIPEGRISKGRVTIERTAKESQSVLFLQRIYSSKSEPLTLNIQHFAESIFSTFNIDLRKPDDTNLKLFQRNLPDGTFEAGRLLVEKQIIPKIFSQFLSRMHTPILDNYYLNGLCEAPDIQARGFVSDHKEPEAKIKIAPQLLTEAFTFNTSHRKPAPERKILKEFYQNELDINVLKSIGYLNRIDDKDFFYRDKSDLKSYINVKTLFFCFIERKRVFTQYTKALLIKTSHSVIASVLHLSEETNKKEITEKAKISFFSFLGSKPLLKLKKFITENGQNLLEDKTEIIPLQFEQTINYFVQIHILVLTNYKKEIVLEKKCQFLTTNVNQFLSRKTNNYLKIVCHE